MGIYRRKKMHRSDNEIYRKYRLRRRTKDLDQIENDLIPENKERLLREVIDEDLPGGGHFLCVECSRHFIDQANLDKHLKGKPHKRRMKDLLVPAYTIEEANAAGGSGSNDFYAKKIEKISLNKNVGNKDFKKLPTQAIQSTETTEESLMAYE